MRETKRILLGVVAALVLLTQLLFPLSSRAGSAPVVLVVVARASALRNVSRAELRRLFMRQAEEIDGERLIPFNHPPGTAIRQQFDRLVLGMSEAEMGRYWVDRKLRDESGPPRTVPSSALLRRVVAALPGAIGYLPSDQVDPGLRILTVDGKEPGQLDYPLN
jgi:hypothetical protein